MRLRGSGFGGFGLRIAWFGVSWFSAFPASKFIARNLFKTGGVPRVLQQYYWEFPNFRGTIFWGVLIIRILLLRVLH